jgi:hypothetical protein
LADGQDSTEELIMHTVITVAEAIILGSMAVVIIGGGVLAAVSVFPWLAGEDRI